MIKFKDWRDQKLVEDSELKAEYDRLGPVYEIITQLVLARKKAGLTQEQLAARMGTKQSVVSRMESGSRMPGMEMVTRYVKATGHQLKVV
ncbi:MULTISPECIES: helix-turn-helix transcriptional regulator [Alphaproteobacteria]|uniref:helix-turn-helix domain-containing protein n=1 Tax=Alphaproteobacteria TaxID=28211 RepID=UPI0032674916